MTDVHVHKFFWHTVLSQIFLQISLICDPAILQFSAGNLLLHRCHIYTRGIIRLKTHAPGYLYIAAFLATIGALWLLGVHTVVGNIFTTGSCNAEEHVLYNITFGQEFVPADGTEYDTSQTYYFVAGYDSAGSKQQVPIPGTGEVVDVRFTKE